MPTIHANAAVWFEYPVTDLDRSIAFFNAVLDAEITRDDTGPNPMGMFPTEPGGVGGHLYPGKPAARGTGPTVHLQSPDSVEAALERVTANGGTVVSPVIEIPVGRFAYCEDPDGNSFGVFTS